MNVFEVISAFEIMGGTAIILLSITAGTKIKSHVSREALKKWRFAIMLMTVLFSGYLFVVLVELLNISFPTRLVTASILLVAACFVYYIIGLNKVTNNLLLKEIAERKDAENKIQESSLTDELTVVCSRRGFFYLIENHFQRIKREQKKALLLYAEIDNLNSINETLGYQEGDFMLIDFGNFLRSTFRKSDIIARIAGDEFVVFLVGARDEDEVTISDNYRKKLEIHNSKRNSKYRLSVSAIVVHFDPEYNDSVDDMLAHAKELLRVQQKQEKTVLY